MAAFGWLRYFKRRKQTRIKMLEGRQILRQEHEAILKMVGAAEEVASRLERGEALRQETLASILEFFWVWLLFDDDQVYAKTSTWHQGRLFKGA